jgi:hypothetical protein
MLQRRYCPAADFCAAACMLISCLSIRVHAVCLQIELISIGAFLLAASAGTRAIYENYRGSARDSIAAVSQAVTRKTDQCEIIAVSNLLALQLCSRLHLAKALLK